MKHKNRLFGPPSGRALRSVLLGPPSGRALHSVLLLLFAFCLLSFLYGESRVKIQNSKDPSHLSNQDPKLSWKLQHRLQSPVNTHVPLKIWIYFTDKGITSQASLKQRLTRVQKSLKSQCIWRRMKVRKRKNLVDYADLPLFQPYVEEVKVNIKRIRTSSRWLNAISAEADISQIQFLKNLGFVRKISLVASFLRNEPFFPQKTEKEGKKQTNLHIDYGMSYAQINQINVLPLHRLGFSGNGVLVCMLDTGFRKSHEIFQHANVIAERDFVNGDNDVQQDLSDPTDYSDSHGTGTWSSLGGYKPGTLVGPAYGADFILAKTETTLLEQPIEEDYWVAGIEWAEGLGAEVVSSSLGYSDWYTFADLNGKKAVTTIAADRAVSLGVVVVTAAGNERNDPWGHIIAPADGFDVIAVGAVNASGQIASFSSPGPTYDGRIKPEVCALGVDNWIAGNNQDGSDTYRQGDGTSFATPLVAGVVALLLEIHRDWTPGQVRSALLSMASRSASPDNDFGWGIVNAALAANLTQSLPNLHSFSIDDDNSGESSGNGNGRAELGEIIEISVSLTNKSQVTALSLEGILSSTHPGIQIFRSKVTFSPLLSFNVQSSEKPFVLKIPAFFPSRHALFRLKVEGPNSVTLYDTLRIAISR